MADSANSSQHNETTEEVDPATGKLVVVWAVVLIPLAYGIYNTILKSVPLFG
jgi:hypothetical protein